ASIRLDLRASALDLRAAGFLLETAPFGRLARPCRLARLRTYRGCGEHRAQTLERRGFVAFEAAVLLRLDDDDAVLGDALIARCEQPRLDLRGQRRAPRRVEAQVGRG